MLSWSMHKEVLNLEAGVITEGKLPLTLPSTYSQRTSMYGSLQHPYVVTSAVSTRLPTDITRNLVAPVRKIGSDDFFWKHVEVIGHMAEMITGKLARP